MTIKKAKLTFFHSFLSLGIFSIVASCSDNAMADVVIEDNSFVMEEAYNQEENVYQFINFFQYEKTSKSWNYSFTNEIPVRGQTHQFSYTIPVDRASDSTTAHLGNISLNYRYQLYSSENLSVAPRISYIAPTNTPDEQGVQFNLSISYKINSVFVSHYNLGLTHLPRLDETSINYGISGVYLFSELTNFLVEVTGMTSNGETSLLVSPGVRHAINLDSGWQIVPGLGFPVGVGAAKGEYGIIAYLSFEK